MMLSVSYSVASMVYVEMSHWASKMKNIQLQQSFRIFLVGTIIANMIIIKITNYDNHDNGSWDNLAPWTL